MRKKSSMSIARKLLVLTALLLLASCGRGAPVSYYQLAPVKGEEPAGAKALNGDPIIGIGQVRLQEHLDRPQLVTRTGASRLHLADRHRWAEPLAANIAWVLRDNLAALLATEHLLLSPWEQTSRIDYQVNLEILRCEGMEDGTAHLAALWTITDRSGNELLAPRRSSYRIPPATPDQEGLVSALSESLARLSRDIALEISQLRAEASGQQP